MGLIVVDASALVDAWSEAGGRALRALDAIDGNDLAAPVHFDIEAVSGWRKLALRGHMSERAALEAVRRLRRLRIARHPNHPRYERIWSLRENVSAADAAYIALAEHLRARLVTTDARLAHAPGLRCEISLVK